MLCCHEGKKPKWFVLSSEGMPRFENFSYPDDAFEADSHWAEGMRRTPDRLTVSFAIWTLPRSPRGKHVLILSSQNMARSALPLVDSRNHAPNLCQILFFPTRHKSKEPRERSGFTQTIKHINSLCQALFPIFQDPGYLVVDTQVTVEDD